MEKEVVETPEDDQLQISLVDAKMMNPKYDLIEKRGLSQYKLLKSKTISATTMQKLREGKSVTTESISRLCSILDCQPGDIMEYVPGEE